VEPIIEVIDWGALEVIETLDEEGRLLQRQLPSLRKKI
jgi:hypothetical protein